MMKIALERINAERPDFDRLYEMRNSLSEFLEEITETKDSCIERETYTENLNTIIEFMDEKGSFSLLDSFKVPNDAVFDFCYMPTYVCAAILMKAVLLHESNPDAKAIKALPETLGMCCRGKLRGHGYEAFAGQIEAIKIFIKGGLNEFLRNYPDMCPEFTKMFDEIKTDFADKINKKDFTGCWGEDYESDIREINKYFADNCVFVYGTLLEGEVNHRLMESNELIGRGEVAGYDMYDLGYYPGIIPGSGKVKGEVYKVDNIDELDGLEEEGYLYIRKAMPIKTENGKMCMAYVYEYNRSVEGCEKIPYELQPYTGCWDSAKSGHVWYVSYGSNMLRERLACYIEGGYCDYNGKTYAGCADRTMPKRDVPVEIPYSMFFSNYDEGSWENSAVAFLDISKAGKALGRAFLVTEKQFHDIHMQEGPGSHWYSEVVRLDDIAGIPAYTFTCVEEKTKEPIEKVSEAYIEVIRKGIREMHPDIPEKKIRAYIESCV